MSNLGYDNNIFSTNVDRVSDVTGTLSPQLDLIFRPGERSLIQAVQRLDRTFFVSTSSQNTTGALSSLKVEFFANRFRLHGVGSYETVRERPVQRTDLRPRRTDLRAQAGATFEPHGRFSADLSGFVYDTSFRDDETDPDDSFRVEMDRRETGGSLGLTYRVLRKTWLTGLFQTSQADFDQPDNPRNSRWSRALAGFRFDPTASVAGFVRAGVLLISPDSAAHPDFDDLVYDSQLRYRIGYSLLLGLTSSRDVQFALYENNLWFIRSSYGISGSWYMTSRLALVASAGLSFSRFPETSIERRRDRDRLASIGVLRLFGHSMQAVLQYTDFRRNSTVDVFDFDESTVTASFVYVF